MCVNFVVINNIYPPAWLLQVNLHNVFSKCEYKPSDSLSFMPNGGKDVPLVLRDSLFMVCVCGVGEGEVLGVCVCTWEHHTGPKTLPAFSPTVLFSHFCAPSTPSLFICVIGRSRELVAKKVFVLQQSHSFTPRHTHTHTHTLLWLSNEAAYCLIDGGTQETSLKKV